MCSAEWLFAVVVVGASAAYVVYAAIRTAKEMLCLWIAHRERRLPASPVATGKPGVVHLTPEREMGFAKKQKEEEGQW